MSVLWPLEPATAAEHQLYKRYLDAWWPILLQPLPQDGRLRPRVTYLDAFAGPGRYEGGEEGSPVLEAGTELIIGCGCWLRREDFTSRFITAVDGNDQGPCWPASTGRPRSPRSTPGNCLAATASAASCAWRPASPPEPRSASATP